MSTTPTFVILDVSDGRPFIFKWAFSSLEDAKLYCEFRSWEEDHGWFSIERCTVISADEMENVRRDVESKKIREQTLDEQIAAIRREAEEKIARLTNMESHPVSELQVDEPSGSEPRVDEPPTVQRGHIDDR